MAELSLAQQQALARARARMRIQQSQEQQSQSEPQPSLYQQYVPGAVREAIGAVGDPLATMAMGTVGKVASDVAGLGAIPLHAAGIIDTMPQDVQKNVQQAFAYKPQTELGAITTMPIEALGQGIDYAATAATSGLPETVNVGGVDVPIQAGVKEALMQAPALLGAKKSATLQAKGAREKAAYAKRDEIRAAGQSEGLIAPPETNVAKKFLYSAGRGKDAVSLANQQKVTNLIARDVGMPEGVPITPGMIADRRSVLNSQYDAIPKALPSGVSVTPQFANRVNTLVNDLSRKIQESPKTYADLQPVLDVISEHSAKMKSVPIGGKQVAVALDAQTVMDDISFLREKAGKAYQAGDKKIGGMYRKLADDYEGMVSDSLKKAGNFKAFNEFENARTQHAKLHFMEDVIGNNGLVDFNLLRGKSGRSMKKRAYLTGNTKVAADFATEFPTATRQLTTADIENLGKWEVTVPAMSAASALFGAGAMAGSPMMAGMATIPAGVSYLSPILGRRGMLQSAPNYTYPVQQGALGMFGTAPLAYETNKENQ